MSTCDLSSRTRSGHGTGNSSLGVICAILTCFHFMKHSTVGVAATRCQEAEWPHCENALPTGFMLHGCFFLWLTDCLSARQIKQDSAMGLDVLPGWSHGLLIVGQELHTFSGVSQPFSVTNNCSRNWRKEFWVKLHLEVQGGFSLSVSLYAEYLKYLEIQLNINDTRNTLKLTLMLYVGSIISRIRSVSTSLLKCMRYRQFLLHMHPGTRTNRIQFNLSMMIPLSSETWRRKHKLTNHNYMWHVFTLLMMWMPRFRTQLLLCYDTGAWVVLRWPVDIQIRTQRTEWVTFCVWPDINNISSQCSYPDMLLVVSWDWKR